MKKLKIICTVIGIIILILISSIIVNDLYYTIKIKKEINLSEEQKKQINEKELITDIKIRLLYGGKPKYAKYGWENTDASSYPKGATIPAIGPYDPMYGIGYIFYPKEGKFVDNINYNMLYYAGKKNSMVIYNIGLILFIMIITELILCICYFIKKMKNEKSTM